MKRSVSLALVVLFVCISEFSFANGPGDLETAGIIRPADYSLNMLKKRRRGGRRGAYAQGSSYLAVGYGFPNLLKTVLKLGETEGFKATGMGPFHVKYEYGVSKKIGLGLSLNYVNFGFEQLNTSYTSDAEGNDVPVTYKEKLSVSNVSALVRMNIHFGKSKKFDPYFGAGLGANFVTVTYSNTDPTDEQGKERYKFPGFLAIETVFGSRFYFSDNIGAYAEVGFAKSLAQAGICFKF